MFWPFRRKQQRKTIGADVTRVDGGVRVDVRGQTCPGYLLSINRAMGIVGPGTDVDILTTYAPCGEDVAAWCKEKGFTYRALEQVDGVWCIRIRT